MIDLEDVRRAARRLDGVANRTPVITSRALDSLLSARLFLKAEVFQRAGAFKFRGAYNKIAALSDDELRRGVLAFSSGNHAQAVALAASLLGAHATIVMPDDAPAIKLAATRGYGAEIVTYDRYTDDREAIALAISAERGLTVVPPYDDPLVMAGQGTVALELLEEVGELDVLVVPVSGGGLIAGCATVLSALCPRTRVIGVEPEAGDDTRRSLASGSRIAIEIPRTIADALQSPTPGELTFPINRELVDAVATVSDDDLFEAMRFCFARLKLVVEAGGVAGLAALLRGKVELPAEARVGVVLSGGNVDPETFARLVRSYD
jgi:threonine dehydratase